MKTLNCFTMIPTNREDTKSQLILDDKRGWIERPSECEKFEGQTVSVNFDQVYDLIITPALEEVEKQCEVKIESLRGVDIQQAGNIFDQLLPYICNADITITDLTTNNPNVFLEYGIRCSVKDQLNIIIAHEPVKLPFNIEQYRCISYALDVGGADKAKQALTKFIKKYITGENVNLNVESSERIKRNVDLYSGRRREQEVIKAFEPASQLVADLAGFLLKHGNEPLLKQQTFKFLNAVGEMLEKDERGQERAIAHYEMMCEIEGLSKDKREELYLKLFEIYNAMGMEDLSNQYLEKVKNLEGQ